jgi:thioredoxin-dependent peroxiredoxin
MKIGAIVPDLSGNANGGRSVSLSDYRGKFIVLYFYPKDNTTGCTRQALDFRDLNATLGKRGAVVIGVSRDSVKSHDGFCAKHSLPFTLIADIEETWCKVFDVIHEKQLYGRKYLGVVRSTFLIDTKGKLRREWRNVKIPGHAQAVLEALDELRG